MMSFSLRSLFARDFDAPLGPVEPFQAIGDIHGRADLLERLLARLDPEAPLVFTGDYVDRGDESAAVLHRLRALSAESDRVTCLLGNHEEMMLSFLAAPENGGDIWLRNGGLQTVASFSIALSGTPNTADDWIELRDMLRRNMDPGLERWMMSLPRMWQSGNVVAVHAGADPELPIDAQSFGTLTWGHPRFGKTARKDGLWVVHGHTIVDAPRAADGIISIDTGAYATGVLTAAAISDQGVTFIGT